jgi:ANTAR domain
MTPVEAAAGQPDGDQERQLRQLVSSLRARGGVGAVSPVCHGDVPEVDGVVLTVLAAHAGRIVLSDSGPHGDHLEDLHATLDEGPAIDAADTSDIVTATDLHHAPTRARWPHFAEHAIACGIRAVFAYPVQQHTRPVGVLSLYRAVPGPLPATRHEQIQRYAAAVPILLLDDLHLTDAGGSGMTLPAYAEEVQQAIGVVMEYADVDAATALHRLRAYARHSTRPMRDVIADVRALRLPFDPTAPT